MVVLVTEQKNKEASVGRTRDRTRPRLTAPPKPVQYIMDVEVRVDPVIGGRCAYLFNRPGDPLGS